MHWFALTVRPQHEKAVADSLAARSLESYVPLYRDRRRWTDRVKTVEIPVFSRYVFSRFSFNDRLKVLSTPGVVSVVSFGGKPAPLADDEVPTMKALVGSGLPVAPWDYLRAGQRVLIREGPMSGLEGIMLREKSALRIVVNIELLQRAIAVEIDRRLVRALNDVRSPLAALFLSRTD